MTLDPIQLRVLGSLIEKEIATPENYPLSLNSLIAACNQRSSRDPVLDLDEGQVREALHTLEELGFVTTVRDSRVAKFEHRARTVLNLRRDETAALCLLLLRGPQTPGEIRSRADRLYTFDDISAVQSTLERLASRTAPDPETSSRSGEFTGPLAVLLPRQPGSRESRYAHLLGDASPVPETVPMPSSRSDSSGRLAELEAEVTALRTIVTTLEQRVTQLESKL